MEDVTYDMHFTNHGVVWMNLRAKNFINTYFPNLTKSALYRLALEEGFHISCETEEIRARLSCAAAGNTRT